MNRLHTVLCLLFMLLPVAQGAELKVLRYALEAGETGFDPAEINDLYSRMIVRNIFDAPLRFAYLATPGTLEPSTADGMPEVSADFRTFTFRIKKGIYFADDPAFNGQRRELTAQDYVYSIKRLFDPHWKSPAYDDLVTADILGMQALREEAIRTGHFDYDRPVEGLKALDRYTLLIRLGVAQPRFLQSFSDGSETGAVAREVVERYGDRVMEHPVGTGPFRLAEWRRSSFIALNRNPGYRSDIFHVAPDPTDAEAQRMAKALDGRRLPLIDRVELSVIEESQPRWLSFLNGEVDMLYNMPRDLSDLALPGGKPAPILVRKHVKIERVPQIDVTMLVFNMDNPVVGGYTPQKVALRRAISLGFDTAEAIRTYWKFQAFPAQTIIMPGEFGYDAALRTENGVTSVARAKALLDEYGYRPRPGGRWRANPDGSPLVVEMSTEPDQRSRVMDEIFKRSMDALDIRTTFKVALFPDNLKAARAGNFMMWLMGESASGPDPTGGMMMAYGPATGGQNLSRFKLAAYDSLYLKQDEMPDGPARFDVLRQMNMLLTAYDPMKFVSHRYTIDLTYPWVKYYRHWPFIQGGFWTYVDIDQALKDRTLHH